MKPFKLFVNITPRRVTLTMHLRVTNALAKQIKEAIEQGVPMWFKNVPEEHRHLIQLVITDRRGQRHERR